MEKKWNKFLVAKGEIEGKIGLPIISYREQAKWGCGLHRVSTVCKATESQLEMTPVEVRKVCVLILRLTTSFS